MVYIFVPLSPVENTAGSAAPVTAPNTLFKLRSYPFQVWQASLSLSRACATRRSRSWVIWGTLRTDHTLFRKVRPGAYAMGLKDNGMSSFITWNVKQCEIVSNSDTARRLSPSRHMTGYRISEKKCLEHIDRRYSKFVDVLCEIFWADWMSVPHMLVRLAPPFLRLYESR